MIIGWLNESIMNISQYVSLLDGAEGLKFFGVKLMDVKDFSKLLVRFLFNLLFVVLLVRGVYYPAQRRKDFLFSYISLGMIIFLLCYVLVDVDMDTGFALGLFAIFGIIRYRTDAIPIKEMTYLFIAIGLSVLNALAGSKVSYAELGFANMVVIAGTYGLEKVWLLRHEESKVIVYEKIELVKAQNHEALIEDIQERTGINVTRIEVGKVDFLRDTANVTIFYYEDDQPSK
ncbi:MAG TPA: DUF4956 domain-containing protein [Flavobacteriales bacterium]|nr:DUF4956 domain-containing protein [Flavobacteriales bacterium]|tara:strand:- start:4299 stop:4991 length:693 start_codon:yes stop_codon:yes gene_type:complete